MNSTLKIIAKIVFKYTSSRRKKIKTQLNIYIFIRTMQTNNPVSVQVHMV